MKTKRNWIYKCMCNFTRRNRSKTWHGFVLILDLEKTIFLTQIANLKDPVSGGERQRDLSA